MPPILVTGGCGFIGSNLVNFFARKDQEVIVLDDLSNSQLCEFPRNVEFYRGDIRDTDLVAKLIREVSYIFHFAAVTAIPRTIHEWTDAHSVNLGGTVALFEIASQQQTPPPVVFASSSAVYGNSIIKNSEFRDTDPVSPYGLDKLVCEKQAELFGKLKGLKTIGLRLFNVYGNHANSKSDYVGVIDRFIRNILSGGDLKIYGDGKQTRDFIHIDDVVNIAYRISSSISEMSQVINVASGKSASILEVAEELISTTGINIEITHDPGRPGDIYKSLADISVLQGMLPDYKFVSLNDGLGITLQRYKASLKN